MTWQKWFGMLAISSLILTSCGGNNNRDLISNSSTLNSSAIAIDGGSVTKEMIIRTNNLIAHSSSSLKLVSGALSENKIGNSSYTLSQQDSLYESIRKTKESSLEDLYQNSGKDSIIKPENYINLGVTLAAGTAAIMFTPGVALAGSAALVFGGDALKGFISNKRENEFEQGLNNLNERKSRDILLLAIQEGKFAGDRFIENLIVGSDPKLIKEKIFQYQSDILKKSNLSEKDMELFLKNSNDNFLLGLALTIKDRQDILNKDSASIVKSLNKTNLLLEDMKNSTLLFAKQQALVLEEIRKQFSTDEQTIIINALFDRSNTNKKEILLSPEDLTFFKNHPSKLNTFKRFLNDDPDLLEALKNIVSMQEKAQAAYAYLQVTNQIANNLNLNPEINKVLNDGASVASAVSSISSFMLTSNPLDALSAVSSITSVFSKPKPDPRFSAIFDNFKALQSTLGKIQKQLEVLDHKLDNLDIGLKYVIAQNQSILDLDQEKNNEPLYDCDKLSLELKKRTNGAGLTYLHLVEEFSDGHQGETEKINRCLNYLSDTFNDSLKYKRIYFSNQVNPDLRNEDMDMQKYYATINKLSSAYSTLIRFQPDAIRDNEIYSPKNLLSSDTIITNVRQLLANVFLYDLVTYNRQTHNWDLVNYSQIPSTVKTNLKSEALIKDALKLVNISIIQQGVIDGSSMNEMLLKNFWFSPATKCEDIQFNSLPCLALLNPTLAHNFITASFEKLIGENYYQAWKKIASNNPEWLNRKLGTNPLKVVWIGKGVSPLFTGEIRSSVAGLPDGAYISIGNNNELFALPKVGSLNSLSMAKSQRLMLLIDYKKALENELVERKLNQNLSDELLSFYNNEKSKQLAQ